MLLKGSTQPEDRKDEEREERGKLTIDHHTGDHEDPEGSREVEDIFEVNQLVRIFERHALFLFVSGLLVNEGPCASSGLVVILREGHGGERGRGFTLMRAADSTLALTLSSMALSMGEMKSAQPRDMAQRIVPNQSAKGTPAELAKAGERRLLKTEPSLATERFNPKAKATSLPANQSARMEELATEMLSPPNPKTILPRNMTGQDLMETPKAKMTCPMAIKETKITRHTRTPNFAIKYPPKNGKKMLGME
jgi:hypothetical protein